MFKDVINWTMLKRKHEFSCAHLQQFNNSFSEIKIALFKLQDKFKFADVSVLEFSQDSVNNTSIPVKNAYGIVIKDICFPRTGLHFI